MNIFTDRINGMSLAAICKKHGKTRQQIDKIFKGRGLSTNRITKNVRKLGFPI